MSYVATMGTSSCATIAIGGFKDGQHALNEAYKANPTTFVPPSVGYSVEQFYSKVLYPTAQELGRSHDLPLEKMMQGIDACDLKGKFIIATFNQTQWLAKDGYWAKELRRHGFKLVTKTNNDIGSMNYIYIRAPLEVPITAGEE